MIKDDLELKVTPIVEDLFFAYLSVKGKVDENTGNKLAERVRQKYSANEISDAMMIVLQMERNMEKYGIPCSGWPE